MTGLIIVDSEIEVGSTSYRVETDESLEEFVVTRMNHRGWWLQFGDSITIDRPLSEYTAHDYDQFVRDALAAEADR